MTPEELAQIRERDAGGRPSDFDDLDLTWALDIADADRRTLLAHIDAITEAVEGMPAVVTFSRCWDDHEGPDGGHADGSECPDQFRPPRQGVDRAAVLALLRGAR